jgi:aspartyl-tRNA(Asn)/glutamyl-tRNA(Gln) amidotransferase subunit A
MAQVSAGEEEFFRWTMRILRNVGVVNFLDGCAATLPCHPNGSAPVGLSVCGPAMSDRHVLATARAIEGVLAARG